MSILKRTNLNLKSLEKSNIAPQESKSVQIKNHFKEKSELVTPPPEADPPLSAPSFNTEINKQELNIEEIVNEVITENEKLINEQLNKYKTDELQRINQEISQFKSQQEEQLDQQKQQMIENIKTEAITPLRTDVLQAIDEIVNQKNNLFIHYKEEALKFALKIAELILNHEVKSNPEICNNVVQDALRQITDKDKVTIIVNPVDAANIRENVESYLTKMRDIKKLEVQEDSSVEQGGCIIETKLGYVDSTLSTKINSISSELFKVLTEEEKRTSIVDETKPSTDSNETQEMSAQLDSQQENLAINDNDLEFTSNETDQQELDENIDLDDFDLGDEDEDELLILN